MVSDCAKLQATAVKVLGGTAHLSAPFIFTFLLVHLSAPASATLGGSALASQTMLLGREYYQTSFTEPFLILTPLALHALSGLLKRLISRRGRPPRPITSVLSITGYATMFVFLPVHFLTHRNYPMIETPPILGVGPAELDYEFIKTGLKTWPIRSWFLYGGLVLSTTLHLADGMQNIWNAWLKNALCLQTQWRFPHRRLRTVLNLCILALPTLLGLYVVSDEPVMTYRSMASRYKAAFRSSFVYRF